MSVCRGGLGAGGWATRGVGAGGRAGGPPATAACLPPSQRPAPPLRSHPSPQAYFILDELLLAGEVQETSKRTVGRVIEAQDQLVENAKAGLAPAEGERGFAVNAPRG